MATENTAIAYTVLTDQKLLKSILFGAVSGGIFSVAGGLLGAKLGGTDEAIVAGSSIGGAVGYVVGMAFYLWFTSPPPPRVNLEDATNRLNRNTMLG